MSAPIEFTQGETVEGTLTITDGVGAAVDITNDTFEGKIKALDDLTITLATFTFTLEDGPGGKTRFKLSSADTLAIPANVEFSAKGVPSATPTALILYDMYRTAAVTLVKSKVADGTVTVSPTITLTAT